MNRGSILTNVRSNLYDNGITFYSDQAINDAIQDAYNEVAAKCRCIVKSTTVNQVASQPYYDFQALGTADYLGTVAIFNLETNFWLRDDISLRDFDRLRRDWETWSGQPQFWAPHSQRLIAISPNLSQTAGEQFTLWYWAIAPTIILDTDVLLVATDQQPLLEYYATGDLLQNAEEVTKAQGYLTQYQKQKELYKNRCVDLARADILLRV